MDCIAHCTLQTALQTAHCALNTLNCTPNIAHCTLHTNTAHTTSDSMQEHYGNMILIKFTFNVQIASKGVSNMILGYDICKEYIISVFDQSFHVWANYLCVHSLYTK